MLMPSCSSRQLLPSPQSPRVTAGLPAARVRRHEAGLVLQHVGRGREAGLRQPRRQHAGLRGAPGMQRLGHGAEIRHRAGRERGRDRDRIGGLVGIQPIEPRAGRRRRQRSPDRGRVEAALVQRAGLELLQQRPHLVARHIGGERLFAARAERPAFGEDRGRERGARMPVHADIVIVEHMRRHAVDERGVAGRQVAPARDLRRAVIAGRGRHHLRHQLHGRLVRARDHGADAVEHADARAVSCSAPARRRLAIVATNFAMSDVSAVMNSSFAAQMRTMRHPRLDGQRRANVTSCKCRHNAQFGLAARRQRSLPPRGMRWRAAGMRPPQRLTARNRQMSRRLATAVDTIAQPAVRRLHSRRFDDASTARPTIVAICRYDPQEADRRPRTR